ncbi:MAG: YceI family protein [Nitrospinae bacterium]|nr:YceI family protein [Nitrospinota bacterium]
MRCFAILFLLLSAPAAAEQPLPPSSPAAAYSIGPNSSASYEAYAKVFFLVPNTIGGTSGKVTGTISLDGAVNGRVIIDAASFTSGIDRRDAHIREILQTGTYPTIVFNLIAIEPLSPSDPSTFTGEKTVRGALTIRGVTRDVSFPVTINLEGMSLVIDGAVEVKYTDFGMEPPTLGGIVKRADDRLLLKAHLAAYPEREASGNE